MAEIPVRGTPPTTCPIGWQPHALAPVFYGTRDLAPWEHALRSVNPRSGVPGAAPPVPLRIFFPSLDGAVGTAPILQGCGRYPVVLFAHGHCHRDTDHYRRWFRIPAQLARAGYVVVVPHLAGNAGGQYHPSSSNHPDEATLASVLSWVRSDWVHAELVLPPPATGVVGHSYGAMVGARFAVDRPVSAYAGLSGGWQEWFGGEPFPLPLLDMPTLLAWGLDSDQNSPLSDATWQAMARPRHRVVFAEGQHWDYLDSSVRIPCQTGRGECPHVAGATADLLTMFFGRYLPPEFAPDLSGRIPPTLAPPPLNLTVEQEFYAGGYLGGYQALGGHAKCGVTVSSAVEAQAPRCPVPQRHREA